jgi:hypothetical protein
MCLTAGVGLAADWDAVEEGDQAQALAVGVLQRIPEEVTRAEDQ